MRTKKMKRTPEEIKKSRLKQRRISISKLKIMRILFLACFIFLGGTVLYIKLVKGEEYERNAIEQQVVSGGNTDRPIKPNRGSIMDRVGHILATSTTVYNVFLDVKYLVKEDKEIQEDTITKLNEILEIPLETLNSYIKMDSSNTYLKSQHLILKKGVDKDVMDRIKEANPKWVFADEDTYRTYINDNLASHLIGFMTANNKWGLEKYYDKYLIGEEGRTLRLNSDIMESETRISPPKQGDKVTTTIDINMQKICEEVTNRIGEELAPLNASIIAMNPNTGEILSWAEYPNFNLNEPSNIEKANDYLLKAKWDNLGEDERLDAKLNLWKDFNLSSTFEPGSIYKPLVVAAALEENLIPENKKFYCGGEKWFGSTNIPCHYSYGHGNQTLKQALANSCNIALMDIVAILGPEKYYQYQQDFGFGQKTGIDLPNEESSAVLLNTLEQLKHSVYLATNSMGQGFNVTSIQMINAFAATINGGNLMKPYVVSQVMDKDNNCVVNNKPTVLRKVISKDVSDNMREMLQAVISSSGTGRNAMISGYNIGGKTGTAQQGRRADKRHVHSFIGYLTVENPQIIVSVVISEPQNKEVDNPSAVPYFRDVMLKIIKYKSIEPTGTVSAEDDINFKSNSFELPSLAGTSVAYASETLNSLGLDYDFVGNQGDIVKSIYPPAGTMVNEYSKILVYITTSEGGVELVKIPSVVGYNQSYAQEIMENTGLIPIFVDADYSESFSVTTDSPTTFYYLDGEEQENDTEENYQSEKSVVIQTPAPDIEVSKGTFIRLKIR